MSYERGGRADKRGNRYEINCIIDNLLDVVEEKISYVIVEALGEDEAGADFWVGYLDNHKEAKQCKARAGGNEYWTFSLAHSKGIFLNWKKQLSRDENVHVSLVSPLVFTALEDLTDRARNTNIENPNPFYEVQVKGSGKDLKNLFDKICNCMEINYSDNEGLKIAVDYFSRMHYRQVSDSENKGLLLKRIELIFSQQPEEVFSAMVEFLLHHDILGKKIDLTKLKVFFRERGFRYSNLTKDEKILPRIEQLNEEYHRSYFSLNAGLLQRKVSKQCISYIEEGYSIIIHGNAGVGKSGCTENIMQFCDTNDIVYLAIKLDKRFPQCNSSKWGESLGFSTSIVNCVNAISNSRRAVIILDQLDALRWTHSNSGDAIDICAEIIDEVKLINQGRRFPISLIFVCRTYDIEHDKSIHRIISENDTSNPFWKKVCVENLEQEQVKKIVGSIYDRMSVRLQNLLLIPANLYIWEHLDEKNTAIKIETTSQLIEKWWEQIVIKAHKIGISNQEIEKVKNDMVNFCDERGRTFVPRSYLRETGIILNFLESNEIVMSTDEKISFAHQSLLDYFISKEMLEKYYKNNSILEIIGSKEKQTLNRRYQVQLFLQRLAEYSFEDLVEFGDSLLNSSVRYSIKYVLLELLSEIETQEEILLDFIMGKMESYEWRRPFLNEVIYGNKRLVQELRKRKILQSWMKEEDTKKIVVNLMSSISHDFDDEDIEFIKQYLFVNQEDELWESCFYTDIDDGGNDYFELKYEYYKKYPQSLNCIHNWEKISSTLSIRIIKILALMLEFSIKNQARILYDLSEVLVDESSEVIFEDYKAVFKYLLSLLPDVKYDIKYTDWVVRFQDTKNLQRLYVQLIKKASHIYAKEHPEELLKIYNPYMGKGNPFYNELILDGIYYLPENYSDFVISYLCDNFDKNLFEDTSGNDNVLSSAKRVIGKFSKNCSDSLFTSLEEKVINYNSPRMIQRYRSRLDENKKFCKDSDQFNQSSNLDKGNRVYWRFWGDFQMEMLSCLPEEKMSKNAISLLSTLKRNMKIEDSVYRINRGGICNVYSPISGKDLSSKDWQKILTNKKIEQRLHHAWQETENGYVDCSFRSFVSSFGEYVSKSPTDAIHLILDNDYIHREYIDILFQRLAYLDNMSSCEVVDLEKLILKFENDFSNSNLPRAKYICEIVENKAKEKWSDSILNIIFDIALHCDDLDLNNAFITTKEDISVKSVQTLETDALNCTAGSVARTISRLIEEHSNLFLKFKDAIEKMAVNRNPIIRYSSLWCLFSCISEDEIWAISNIMKILKEDYRCVAFRGIRWFLVKYFKEFEEEILSIMEQCVNSSEDRLRQVSGYSIIEFNMQHSACEHYISSMENLPLELRNYMLEMLIVYFKSDKYKSRSKVHLLEYLKTQNDINHYIWLRLFEDKKIDMDTDRNLIEDLLSKQNMMILEKIYDYISDNYYRREYSQRILDECENMIRNENVNRRGYMFENAMAKLVISIYHDNVGAQDTQKKEILNRCLDILDLMYERDFYDIKRISSKFLKE